MQELRVSSHHFFPAVAEDFRRRRVAIQDFSFVETQDENRVPQAVEGRLQQLSAGSQFLFRVFARRNVSKRSDQTFRPASIVPLDVGPRIDVGVGPIHATLTIFRLPLCLPILNRGAYASHHFGSIVRMNTLPHHRRINRDPFRQGAVGRGKCRTAPERARNKIDFPQGVVGGSRYALETLGDRHLCCGFLMD